MNRRGIAGSVAAAVLVFGFGFLAPVPALAFYLCPITAQTADEYTATYHLPVFPLDSYGTTGVFVGGDPSGSGLLPKGIVCDLTHPVGGLDSGNLNFSPTPFSPLITTGGTPYFGQTSSDTLVVIFSTQAGLGGTDTGALFFTVDSNGLVWPLSNPPVVSGVSIASNNASTTLAKPGDAITVTFTSDSDVQTPDVHIGTHAAAVATTTGNSFTASTTLDSGDATGPVSFSIKLTNYFGNPGFTTSTTTDNSSVTFDKTPPVITITSGPAGGSVSTSSPTAFAFTVDADASSTCAFDGAATSSCSGTVSQALADGAHTFAIVATDPSGNTTSTTTVFMLDTTPPTLAITAGLAAGATSATSSVSFTFTTDAAAVLCSYDGAATTTCASPFATTSADGAHTLALSATDDNGNTSYLSRAFTIDTAPAPVAANNPGGNGPPVAQSAVVIQPVVAPVPAPVAQEEAPAQPPPVTEQAQSPAQKSGLPGRVGAGTGEPRTFVQGIAPTSTNTQGAAVATAPVPGFQPSPWLLLSLPAVGGLWWGGRKFFGYTMRP